MDKVKKILEQYVQWLVLGLALAFLGWNLYAYIFQDPVTIDQFGTSPGNVPPSQVSKLVWEGAGKQLRTQIDSKAEGMVATVPPDLASSVVKPLSTVPEALIAPTLTTYVPTIAGGALPPEEKVMHDHDTMVQVTSLPVGPPPTKPVCSLGHTNVPAPVVVGNANQPMAVDKSAIDVNWVTAEASIPCIQLGKTFKDAKIPDGFSSTWILRVEMSRQEQFPDGTWGSETIVPPLDITALKPMPGNGPPTTIEEQNDYRDWAQQPADVTLICQPPFYTKLQGDSWYEPGTPNPNIVNNAIINDGFDPQHPEKFKGDPNSLTPKDRELYQAYLDKMAKLQQLQQQQNTRPNNNTQQNNNNNNNGGQNRGGGGGGGGGGRRGAIMDPQRGSGGGGSGGGDNLMPPGGGSRPGYRPPMQQGVPPQGFPIPNNPNPMPGPSAGPANTAIAAATLPPGVFFPAQQPAITVWAHDVTAEAGKTYHYKLRYVFANPVGHTRNVTKPESLADVFYIASQWSDWTDPVNVESDTKFFATAIKKGISFDIFKWKNGAWQMQTVDASPGDMVGSLDTGPAQADFRTGWTLVEYRKDPRDDANDIIILVSDNGAVKKKELTLDQRSVEYQDLLNEVKKNPPSAAAAGGSPRPNG